jgi:hypothetical protein
VKLEQASKVKSWKPTRRCSGEGHGDREEAEDAPVATTGVVSTACPKGDLVNRGRPRREEGHGLNAIDSDGDPLWGSERVI